MAVNRYAKTSLMGNWYEERLANEQKLKDEPAYRYVREEDPTISFMSNNNLLMPLGRVGRAHKWDTSAVLVNDGFTEYKTVNKTNYDPTILKNYQGNGDCRPLTKSVGPKRDYPENYSQIQTGGSRQISMLNATNMQKQVNEIKRDVVQKPSDFGSTLRKHEDDHQRFFVMTTNHQFYDRPAKSNLQEYNDKTEQKLKTASGFGFRPVETQGIKMNSTLTGEIHKSAKDPQQNTLIQRSWLPYTENAIVVAEQNLTANQKLNESKGLTNTNQLSNYRSNLSQTKNFDIATSLPVAEGEYTLKSKWMESGSFRRIRTDITLVRNNPITRK